MRAPGVEAFSGSVENIMKIALGSDHRGYPVKEAVKRHLEAQGHQVEDFGCYSEEAANYVVYARQVAMAVREGRFERGVLLCNDGLGMSIVANKVPGIRCALCTDCYYARIAREHNDANILAFGCRTPVAEALKIVDTWLATPFEGGRHIPRLEMITRLEQEMMGREH